MKKYFVFLCFIYSFSVKAAEYHYPKLFFSYSRLYDNVCSQIPGNAIKEEWVSELKGKIPEFKNIWIKESPILMVTLFKKFHMGFSRKELTATLSVCPNASSFSDPLVLNVYSFLNSSMGNEQFVDSYKFTDIVFHELLHTWVSEHINLPSPLIEKYKDENKVVINHLHLMALQKYIYTKLNRLDMINWINQLYSTSQDLNYRRAWDIVNRIEKYDNFIKELLKNKIINDR